MSLRARMVEVEKELRECIDPNVDIFKENKRKTSSKIALGEAVAYKKAADLIAAALATTISERDEVQEQRDLLIHAVRELDAKLRKAKGELLARSLPNA